MPNWAYTHYKIEGDTEELKDLHDKIVYLASCKESPVRNGFGNLWLGNLVHVLGGDWQEIYCRGSITDYDYHPDLLTIFTETAWDEMNEVRHFLCEKYPSLSIWYQTEEPGMCIYETNDASGEYFPDRWILDYELGDVGECEYFEDLKTIVEYLANEELIPADTPPTKEAIVDAMRKNIKDEGSEYVSLNEFQIVDY